MRWLRNCPSRSKYLFCFIMNNKERFSHDVTLHNRSSTWIPLDSRTARSARSLYPVHTADPAAEPVSDRGMIYSVCDVLLIALCGWKICLWEQRALQHLVMSMQWSFFGVEPNCVFASSSFIPELCVPSLLRSRRSWRRCWLRSPRRPRSK